MCQCLNKHRKHAQCPGSSAVWIELPMLQAIGHPGDLKANNMHSTSPCMSLALRRVHHSTTFSALGRSTAVCCGHKPLCCDTHGLRDFMWQTCGRTHRRAKGMPRPVSDLRSSGWRERGAGGPSLRNGDMLKPVCHLFSSLGLQLWL